MLRSEVEEGEGFIEERSNDTCLASKSEYAIPYYRNSVIA